jgi:hypothetical protein
VGVASVPVPSALLDGTYEHGFLVTFRSDANVRLLRFYDDGALDSAGGAPGTEPRPFLRQVGSAPIATNSSGIDSRGVAVDPTRRQLAESKCAGDEACLVDAAEVPLDVFVANRSPASLLIGETKRVRSAQFSVDIPSFYENIPLTEGPSRVVLGHVTTKEGVRERRVFIICFDSATIFVVDPIKRRVESQIQTGRGPQALAFDPDPNRPLAYVAHFTDSYLGVLSLDQRFPMTYGAVVARIGTPTPPRASK